MEAGGIPITIAASSLAAPGSVRVNGAYGDGVAMLVPEIDPTSGREQWELFFLGVGVPEWTRMATVTTQVGVRGRPAIAQVPYPHGDRLVVVWTSRTAMGNNNHLLQYAETSYNSYQFQLQERLHSNYQTFMDPVMVYDDRASVYPPGLRVVRGEWVRCGDPGTACDAWTTCTTVAGTGQDLCQDNDEWFGRIIEFLLPFADGVFPATLRDYDETPMVDYGFCRALRSCRIDGLHCIPPEYRDVDGGGNVLTLEPCGLEPTY